MRIYVSVMAIILSLGALNAKAYDGSISSVRVRFAIKFDDLNLDRERDAEIMLKRIERAASKACGGHASFSAYTGGLDRTFYECRDEAVRQAVKQLRAPRVGQLYQGTLRAESGRAP